MSAAQGLSRESHPHPARSSAELAVPEAGDLDVLGRLGAQVCVGGLDGLEHARNLASGRVHLHRSIICVRSSMLRMHPSSERETPESTEPVS